MNIMQTEEMTREAYRQLCALRSILLKNPETVDVAYLMEPAIENVTGAMANLSLLNKKNSPWSTR